MIERRQARVPARIFARYAISLLFIALVLAGCGLDGQTRPEPAATDSPKATSTAQVAPIASREPQIKQVETISNENSSMEPVGAGFALTGTAPLTKTVPFTETALLSVSRPLTRTTPLTATVALPPVADLITQLGMTVTSPISGPVAITGTAVITDAHTSPLPTPRTTVLLPTPTPSPATVLAPTVMPEPTPDGVTRTVRVPILMYHYLSAPPADADIYRTDLSVTPERFAAHLDAMQAAGYAAISLYDLLDNLVLGAPLPEKPVIITFDDGYRDNYTNAFSLLHERGMTASFFVVTDFVNEERPAYMTWEMLREMSAGGMDIESHARNHVSLEGKDVDYLVWQALGSLESIEREVGMRPRFVSYPAGDYDQQTIDLFHSANFWAGLTTVQGATHRSDDLFQLHRVRVRGTTTPEELLRLLDLDW